MPDIIDHPSGQPDVDVPAMLQKLEMMSSYPICAVCLYFPSDDSVFVPRQAVTTVAGNAVCSQHLKEGFTLANTAREGREYQKRQQAAKLRGRIGSP